MRPLNTEAANSALYPAAVGESRDRLLTLNGIGWEQRRYGASSDPGCWGLPLTLIHKGGIPRSDTLPAPPSVCKRALAREAGRDLERSIDV